MTYAQERETFGKPIAEHQAIGFKLAEMATKLQAARLMTYDARARVRRRRAHRPGSRHGQAVRVGGRVRDLPLDALRIHGGNGYTRNIPVERYFRDSPLMIIGEGTSEIQKMVISRAILSRAAEKR